jgi:hypothetical protein
MEPGTEHRYIRCRRCHGIFQAGLPNCSRCGAPYVAQAEVAADPGSYADRYQGTEFAEPIEMPAGEISGGGRSGMGLILAVGAALVVTALAVGGLVLMGAFESPPKPTPRNDVVVTKTATPSPSPTLPPTLAKTLAQISDPNMNLHVSIRTTVSVNAKVVGRSMSQTINMDVDCAAGNESGTDKSGGISTEWRLVDGTYYTRALPNGKWVARGSVSPFVALSPLFQLRETKMLQYDGPELKNDVQTDKLESTLWWTPDAGRLSGIDVATLSISPQHTKLMLWVASDGAPVYATFRAWTDASDGTNLLDISTTYAFSNQGAVLPIAAPSGK